MRPNQADSQMKLVTHHVFLLIIYISFYGYFPVTTALSSANLVSTDAVVNSSDCVFPALLSKHMIDDEMLVELLEIKFVQRLEVHYVTSMLSSPELIS